MPAPTSSLATLRPDLSASFQEWSLSMSQKGFIAHQVLPVFEAAEKAGNFGKIPIEQLLQKRETLRAPGSGYSRGNWTFDPATYSCLEYGAEEPVDDAQAKIYREYFDAESVSAMRAFITVMTEAEKRAAALLFNATTWTGASLTTVVTNEWDDATNAIPVTDVEGAVQQIWTNSGLWANALIINRKVFRNLRLCDQIINMVKQQGFQDARPGNVTAAHLAAVFDLERVIVGGSPENTANEGQAAVLAPIWSDEYAMLAVIATSNDITEPVVGRTFHWSEDGSEIGGTFETYREEETRSDIVRVRHDVDEIVLHVQAAHLLSNVTT